LRAKFATAPTRTAATQTRHQAMNAMDAGSLAKNGKAEA
jgi:hypothetical protein